MHDLSIIIVNYNVKYFLKQCIQSIYDSDTSFSYDIWVVDNASNDESVKMIKEDFPQVQLIANKDNKGFSKANNQAIKMIDSRYTLILNPDTLLKNDSLHKCINALEADERIGALGVKMFDGNGNYLPESKRGFPSPWASFCKFSGLGSIFKKSRLFNYYYLGHLDKDEDQDIEILTGAFMMMPTKVLKSVGMFDERFFMYGEDIDLSYKILQEGYKVSYLANTSIIHYKGESTPKGDSVYVKHFYNAMLLFAEKHYGTTKKKGFLMMLKAGVYFSAFGSWMKHVLKTQFRILLDFLFFFFAMLGISKLWGFAKFENLDYYDNFPINKHLFFFTALWIGVNYIFGHYDKKTSYRRFSAGIILSALLMFFIYGIFPESWRFSRAVIFFSIPIGVLILFLTRKVFNKIYEGSWKFLLDKAKRVFIVGSIDSAAQVRDIIERQSSDNKVLGVISPNGNEKNELVIANLTELQQAIRIHNPNEIIFCSKELETNLIFSWITKLGSNMNYKIASKDNDSILGSDSKNRMGNWYTLDVVYQLEDKTRMRLKRMLDLVLSFFVLIFSPFLFLFKSNSFNFIVAFYKVVFRGHTWVGYDLRDKNIDQLPSLKKGIFDTRKLQNTEIDAQDDIHKMNIFYAKNYAVWQDLELFWKNIF